MFSAHTCAPLLCFCYLKYSCAHCLTPRHICVAISISTSLIPRLSPHIRVAISPLVHKLYKRYKPKSCQHDVSAFIRCPILRILKHGPTASHHDIRVAISPLVHKLYKRYEPKSCQHDVSAFIRCPILRILKHGPTASHHDIRVAISPLVHKLYKRYEPKSCQHDVIIYTVPHTKNTKTWSFL